MAVVRKENVIHINADNDTVTGQMHIIGIKYKAGTSADILADASSSGAVLWQHTGTADVFEQVDIKAKNGIYVNIAGSAELLLYLA